MDVLEFRNTYWNYYLQLENDFFSYSPYCEIDPCNDNAFSVKYLQLILSVCSEIDSICKTLCKILDENLNLDTAGMYDYMPILNKNYPTLATEKVKILNYKYRDIMPWKSIARGHIPNWWQCYNEIKHHRDERRNGKENYKYANQKNTLEALCALYILVEYWAARNFATDQAEERDHTLQRLKSTKLELVNWNFYLSFMGQEPWFCVDLFNKYLSGENSCE